MASGDVTKREFSFELKDIEVEDRKNRLIDVERNIDAEVDAKASEMAARNAALKVLRKDRKRLLEACHTGSEKREVEVREEWDFKTNRVVFKRLDTGAQIEERAMSGPERQEEMFGDEPDSETGKAPKNGKGKGKKGGKPTTDKPTRARARKGRLEAVD